jgi:hypothetical protein
MPFNGNESRGQGKKGLLYQAMWDVDNRPSVTAEEIQIQRGKINEYY